MQSYTSRHTSINSHIIPRVYKELLADDTPRTIFDYGCGKFTDHIKDAMPDGVKYIPYDPFNLPGDVNERGIRFLTYIASVKRTGPVDIVCSNVLNVIDNTDTIARICKLFSVLHREAGCGVYITVYEGDKSGVGKQTGIDQYQRNEPLSAYQRFLPGSRIKHKMIVMERGL